MRSSDNPDPVQLIIAEELLRAYDVMWEGVELEVIAVEKQFDCPLVNPDTGESSKTYSRAGKIDTIVRDVRHRVLVVEHKTSSYDIQPGSDYWKMLQLDSQVSDYFVGGRSLGYQIDGCLYDVVGKPKMLPLLSTPIDQRKYTKPTKKEPPRLYSGQREFDETLDEFRERLRSHIAENPARYLQRAIIARTEDDERAAALDSWQIARQMAESEHIGRFPRNSHSCQDYNRMCEYFGVCARTEDLGDETLFRTAKKAHEELE